MIDLHCHILPGIDDGAKDINDSLALVRAAISDGITHIVCTPHIQLGRFDNNINTISEAFNELELAVKQHELSVDLAFAAEVRICPEIMLLAKQNKLPFIGQWQENSGQVKDVLLLELPHSHIPPGTEQLIAWLHKNNIIPMIAHPERNRDIIADVTKFNRLSKLNCLFQITAASLCGGFGEISQKISEQLLLEDHVTIIASDAHSIKRRPPMLTQAKLAAAKIIGEEKAQKLVFDTPKAISKIKFLS
jgi:protein-tyrosine phosphatase